MAAERVERFVDRWPHLDRWAPVSGIIAPVLWLIGLLIAFSNEPDEATPEQLAQWYVDDSTRILTGASLFLLGCLAFIWFLGVLREHAGAGFPGAGRIATVLFAAGFGMITSMMIAIAFQIGGAIEADDEGGQISPTLAETYYDGANGLFIIAMAFLLLLLFSVVVATFRYGAFPLWFGGLSALAALPLLFPPIGWAVLIFGAPVWTVIAAAMLLVDRRRASAGVG